MERKKGDAMPDEHSGRLQFFWSAAARVSKAPSPRHCVGLKKIEMHLGILSQGRVHNEYFLSEP
jgi:hypothetical protein